MTYPIDFQVGYGDGTRNRGYAILGIIWFLKAVLLIPHFIVVAIMGTIAQIAAWVGYWFILFSGRQPDGISKLIAGTFRWSNRTFAWLLSAIDEYPPFRFEDGTYGAQTTITVDGGSRNRLLAAGGIVGIKYLLALPHLIIVSVLASAASVAGWVGFVIIAFNGSLPRGLHDFFIGVLRWSTRSWGWLASLTDEYPPFSLE
jgi:hypothetical protein